MQKCDDRAAACEGPGLAVLYDVAPQVWARGQLLDGEGVAVDLKGRAQRLLLPAESEAPGGAASFLAMRFPEKPVQVRPATGLWEEVRFLCETDARQEDRKTAIEDASPALQRVRALSE
jgi:hypothetical protein